ncbi:MAG: response regulator, partial [Gammaproteobacteria bacterium]|nr:response regulator [Gammaproteobacteria bacterium]
MLGSTLPSSIEVDLQLEGDDLIVMTNPVQLHQLVMNLCINARDAMHGKGHITIGLQRVNSIVTECCSCHERVRGDYIELFFRDTGPGIQPEQMDRLFDPFYTTKDVGKGTGMGLSMVHGIMHDHGGHVLVESGPGKGTTFALLFPVIDVQVDTVNMEGNDANAKSEQVLDGNILIVDDEISVGGFIGEMLKGHGCQVTVETDSKLALSRFRGNPEAFDLVITDQTMPGMTGAELAQSLIAIRPELPVILCTGYSEHLDAVGAEAIGIRGYVNKPIEIDGFLGLVKELLQDREISV